MPALIVIITILIIIAIIPIIKNISYQNAEEKALRSLGINNWFYQNYDDVIIVKSAKAVDNYCLTKYFQEDRNRIFRAKAQLEDKLIYADKLKQLLNSDEVSNSRLISKIQNDIKNLQTYNIYIKYTSPAGRSNKERNLSINFANLTYLIENPAETMSKSEYSKYEKEQNQKLLDEKHHKYYSSVNEIIDLANKHRDLLISEKDKRTLDQFISALFDRTVNSIKKIKTIDSEEWTLISNFINDTFYNVVNIIDFNQKILDYYSSSEFKQIKDTCNSLMLSQREFNTYIDNKVKSISSMFGTRIIRNETITNDKYDYIRPYKKTITPFTAEVSAQIFASAENNPIEYIVKYFYPNKEQYPEQIQKLQTLVEELETLKEAKQIIDNYKKDYQKYLSDVPDYIIQNDENGFYSRLGFANITEEELTIEYKFSYTSDGGFAQRYFSVPMTEETIIELINTLQNKLTSTTFNKEQRSLMTAKLRQHIKERDNYTCKYCGNSVHQEPNLLLEIDHILPVAKGGCTVEENLQTLCWKCNRRKSDKLY